MYLSIVDVFSEVGDPGRSVSVVIHVYIVVLSIPDATLTLLVLLELFNHAGLSNFSLLELLLLKRVGTHAYLDNPLDVHGVGVNDLAETLVASITNQVKVCEVAHSQQFLKFELAHIAVVLFVYHSKGAIASTPIAHNLVGTWCTFHK